MVTGTSQNPTVEEISSDLGDLIKKHDPELFIALSTLDDRPVCGHDKD